MMPYFENIRPDFFHAVLITILLRIPRKKESFSAAGKTQQQAGAVHIPVHFRQELRVPLSIQLFHPFVFPLKGCRGWTQNFHRNTFRYERLSRHGLIHSFTSPHKRSFLQDFSTVFFHIGG